MGPERKLIDPLSVSGILTAGFDREVNLQKVNLDDSLKRVSTMNFEDSIQIVSTNPGELVCQWGTIVTCRAGHAATRKPRKFANTSLSLQFQDPRDGLL